MARLEHLLRRRSGIPSKVTPDRSASRFPDRKPLADLPRRPRILILSAAVGTGHLRAAEAVQLALRQLVPDAQIHSADVLGLSTRVFRFCYAQMYLEFIRHAPLLLGYIYNCFDRPVRDASGFWKHVHSCSASKK
jgi:hypothetical protein